MRSGGYATPLGPLVDIAATVAGDLEVLIARRGGTGPVFGALLRMLAASSRPPVVVLEDLHWRLRRGLRHPAEGRQADPRSMDTDRHPGADQRRPAGPAQT